jgi:hypothetical protein
MFVEHVDDLPWGDFHQSGKLVPRKIIGNGSGRGSQSRFYFLLHSIGHGREAPKKPVA